MAGLAAMEWLLLLAWSASVVSRNLTYFRSHRRADFENFIYIF